MIVEEAIAESNTVVSVAGISHISNNATSILGICHAMATYTLLEIDINVVVMIYLYLPRVQNQGVLKS